MGWPSLKVRSKVRPSFPGRYLHATAHADGTFWASEFALHLVRRGGSLRLGVARSEDAETMEALLWLSLRDVANAGPFASLDEARRVAEDFNAAQGWGQDGVLSVTESESPFRPGCGWVRSAKEAERFRREEEHVFQILRFWPREQRDGEV